MLSLGDRRIYRFSNNPSSVLGFGGSYDRTWVTIVASHGGQYTMDHPSGLLYRCRFDLDALHWWVNEFELGDDHDEWMSVLKGNTTQPS